MTIRLRAVLVIILTNLIIILFSVFVGISYVNWNIDISLETDLTVMAKMADRFISSELNNLKLKAYITAENLERFDESMWQTALLSSGITYSEFIGLAVYDLSGRLIVSSGESPAGVNVINDKYISRAFNGQLAGGSAYAISSTVKEGDDIVFYLAVPFMFLKDRILVLTLPGLYFRHLLSSFVIWDSGHVYMSDRDGYAISNPRENWMYDRFNYILSADTDKEFAELAETVKLMTSGKSGTGYYSVYGIRRTCSYMPVSASDEGWSLGVVAPLPESPVKDIDMGLLLVGLVSFFLNVIAAVIASNFIKRPFEQIEVLKEVAENASKAKSSFLSTMSHEIRTPMNAILGVTEILIQYESLPSEIEEGLGKIYSSCDLLLGIINDILDFSKIEAGKLDIIPALYKTASVINDSIHLNMMRIGSKPIEFELHINEDVPSNIIGDELRIKQILNNLLSNAFKYTEAGRVILTVSSETGKMTDNGQDITLLISVRDTGYGMTRAQLDKLFDEYSRFNQAKNSSVEGTGLGLAITRRLISLMGGEIKVESEPDKGTLFEIRLPQTAADSETLGKEVVENLRQFRMNYMTQKKWAQITRDPMPYGSVLVVDDVETNIYVAVGLMRLYRLQIDTAMRGQEAIDKIKNGRVYDIIFMDHMMPEMDGIEAVRQIRSLGYKEPIIALTANAVSGQSEIFLNNGFDDFISKPIDIRQLNLVLNKNVRDKQPREVIEEARLQNQKISGSDGLFEQGDALKEKTSNLLNKKIDGLDMVKGLQRYEYDEEFFIKVLRTYASSVRLMFESIGNVNADNLAGYRINVHGIKSTSLDICAKKIGENAALLEEAAKNSDMNYINEHNPAFFESIKKFVADIDDLLVLLDKENPKPKKDCPDKKELLNLLSACREYDTDGADNAMEEIEKYQYETDNELVSWLRDNIDRMNFSEMIEKLEKYESS